MEPDGRGGFDQSDFDGWERKPRFLDGPTFGWGVALIIIGVGVLGGYLAAGGWWKS